MTRGQRSENHPSRHVPRERFVGVGDIVHMPGDGPININRVGKKYFSGTSSEGRKIGKTGIGLIAGEKMGKPAQPWRVDRRQQ